MTGEDEEIWAAKLNTCQIPSIVASYILKLPLSLTLPKLDNYLTHEEEREC
jgi:hypothetical protein